MKYLFNLFIVNTSKNSNICIYLIRSSMRYNLYSCYKPTYSSKYIQKQSLYMCIYLLSVNNGCHPSLPLTVYSIVSLCLCKTHARMHAHTTCAVCSAGHGSSPLPSSVTLSHVIFFYILNIFLHLSLLRLTRVATHVAPPTHSKSYIAVTEYWLAIQDVNRK